MADIHNIDRYGNQLMPCDSARRKEAEEAVTRLCRITEAGCASHMATPEVWRRHPFGAAIIRELELMRTHAETLGHLVGKGKTQ